MPLYEYKCDSCSHREEELQSMAEAPLTICPKCGMAAFNRIVGDVHIGLCDTSMCRSALKSRDDLDASGEGDRSELFRKRAEAAGVSTTGKWYCSQLALELGDPEAWVGSIDDIKQVCRRRGWSWKMEDGDIKVLIPADIGKPMSQQGVRSMVGV